MGRARVPLAIAVVAGVGVSGALAESTGGKQAFEGSGFPRIDKHLGR